jgi:SpoVK/Ycf46/Vps4 family AAA+-type ATPase
MINSYLCDVTGVKRDFRVSVTVSPDPKPQIEQKAEKSGAQNEESETDYEKRAAAFRAQDPDYTFDRVILPSSVIERIEDALCIVETRKKVFEEWGLSAIERHPSSALNFYGPSGTGKTMAAEAIASRLGKKIIRVSYADVESKFVGEGPKNIKAMFTAAEKNDAVLFIDEADSLLSKRLTNVNSGNDQAINSMRSDLLICLERYQGIVIFATNLVGNYDPAFLTRLIDIPFVLPDAECRKRIWDVHIYPTEGNGLNIPLSDDVDTKELAERFDGFCGRDIRNAVVTTCIRVAKINDAKVSQADFIRTCEDMKEENRRLDIERENSTRRVSPEVREAATRAAIAALPDREDPKGEDDPK